MWLSCFKSSIYSTVSPLKYFTGETSWRGRKGGGGGLRCFGLSFRPSLTWVTGLCTAALRPVRKKEREIQNWRKWICTDVGIVVQKLNVYHSHDWKQSQKALPHTEQLRYAEAIRSESGAQAKQQPRRAGDDLQVCHLVSIPQRLSWTVSCNTCSTSQVGSINRELEAYYTKTWSNRMSIPWPWPLRLRQ